MSKSEARIWSVGVTLLALALVLAWWLYYGGQEGQEGQEGGAPGGSPSDEDADGSLGAEPTVRLEPLAPGGSLLRATDPVPSRDLRLLLSTPDGARLCEITGTADGPPLERASCGPVEVDAGQARLAAMADGAAATFVMPDGLVRSDGTAWWHGATREAFVASADSAAVLARTDEARELLLLDGAGVARRVEAPDPLGPGSPGLVWDRLMWLERATEEADTLRARDVFGEDGAMEVGRVSPKSERLRGCRSSETLAVAVEGELVHGKKQVAVTFLGDDGWSPPASEEAGIYEYQLSCRGSEAALTWIEAAEDGARRVIQIRCRPGECQTVVGRASFAGSDPTAVDLAGRVLLVWTSGGRTHARLAPLVELDGAESLPTLPQPSGTVLSRHLYVRGGTAVLVYRTADGLLPVRIDATGGARPLPVRERSAL